MGAGVRFYRPYHMRSGSTLSLDPEMNTFLFCLKAACAFAFCIEAIGECMLGLPFAVHVPVRGVLWI